MSTSLWVSMPIIRNIVLGTKCSEEGIDEICQSGGIKRQDLDAPHLRLSLEQNCFIMESAIRSSQNDSLGLHVGESTTTVVLGITGHLMQTSQTLFLALKNLQEFTANFTRLYTFYIEEKGGHVHFYCEPVPLWNDVSPETARHSVDIAYAGTLHIFKLLTGRTFYPKYVKYRYSNGGNMVEYQRIFKCQPQFQQNHNCLIFAKSDLQTPIIGYNDELSSIFKNLLETERQKENLGTTFSNKVKEIILKQYLFHFPQLEEVADKMHLTPRSLQRKLKDENTTFRIITDTIKLELSCHLLKNPKYSVGDIAYKLGYAEPSAFQRAFRNWAGQSPYVFRKQPI